MALSIEQLMAPRYKVIAGYPEMQEHEIEVGDILQDTVERPLITATLDKYPHLFKPLKWWQDRKEEDLPMYAKISAMTVTKYFKFENGYLIDTDGSKCRIDGLGIFIDDILPATEEEYENQKQSI